LNHFPFLQYEFNCTESNGCGEGDKNEKEGGEKDDKTPRQRRRCRPASRSTQPVFMFRSPFFSQHRYNVFDDLFDHIEEEEEWDTFLNPFQTFTRHLNSGPRRAYSRRRPCNPWKGWGRCNERKQRQRWCQPQPSVYMKVFDFSDDDSSKENNDDHSKKDSTSGTSGARSSNLRGCCRKGTAESATSSTASQSKLPKQPEQHQQQPDSNTATTTPDISTREAMRNQRALEAAIMESVKTFHQQFQKQQHDDQQEEQQQQQPEKVTSSSTASTTTNATVDGFENVQKSDIDSK